MPQAPDLVNPWACHALIFAVEACCAMALGARWMTSSPSLPLPCGPRSADAARLDASLAGWWVDANAMETLGNMVADSFPAVVANVTGLHTLTSTGSKGQGRRLVANDFTADFSRRLAFHTWIEEDVVLDRKGLERYLRRALSAAGLSKQQQGRAARPPPAQRPRTVEALQHEYTTSASFAFSSMYAAHAHQMVPGAPWAHGRDDFMRLVRLGLRPNHYFLSLGCGSFATGHHVVRYLLTGRYSCIEANEYLVRAAVEYEIPSKGLIHKRPRLVFDELSEMATLMRRPPSWLPTPPSYFDFAAVEVALSRDGLERTVTNVARYLRPRSGRLVLQQALPERLQAQLGLQLSRNELGAAVDTDADPRSVCPFSVRCAMYVYHT